MKSQTTIRNLLDAYSFGTHLSEVANRCHQRQKLREVLLAAMDDMGRCERRARESEEEGFRPFGILISLLTDGRA